VALHCSHEQWRRGAKEEEGGREVSGKTNRVTSPGGVAGGDGSGSSSVYLHFFFSLFMFSRFSVFSSISVDDGAVVAADGGVAVAVLLLSSVSPCFFFLFVLFGFSPLFFLSIRLCFFFFFSVTQRILPLPISSLSPGIYKEEKKGERATTPVQSWHRGRVAGAATVQ
jgi:hypothetical protein